MAKYWVLAPCAFMHNGRALYYKTAPREPVEIDDIVASFLGAKVRRVDPFVEPFVETRPAKADGVFSVDVKSELTDPLQGSAGRILRESLPVEEPKPKRKRKVEEEKPDGDTEFRG